MNKILKYFKSIGVLSLIFVITGLFFAFTNNNNSDSAFQLKKVQLKDDEEVKLYQLMSFENEPCVDFSLINAPKTPILIRSLENEVRFNDVFRMGVENFSYLRTSNITDYLQYWSSSTDKIHVEYAKVCPWENNKFSSNCWVDKSYKNKTYYTIDTKEDSRFKDLVISIFKNATTREWLLNTSFNVYDKISNYYPADWKLNILKQLRQMDSFLMEYSQNPEPVNNMAKNYGFQFEVGHNQAMLYRRINNDGVSAADLRETIKKINLKVLESLDNSMHKFVRTILINNVYEINESFSDEMGEKSYKITTKQSDKIINVKYNQIYKLKILNEGKKNYLLISSYDNKNILLDEKLNELLNTY